MKDASRLVAGAVSACLLVTPSAALADPTSPASPVTPGTSIPIPDAVAQWLAQNGLQVAPAGTQAAPPATTLPCMPLPSTPTTPTTVGTAPLPQGGATGSGGLQCGQLIVNNNVYIVTVTTTTTTADGPIAAGPVTEGTAAPTRPRQLRPWPRKHSVERRVKRARPAPSRVFVVRAIRRTGRS